MKKHAFTLVELLVVIGIIGILSALIIPAVGLARASAKATQCQHNQEQTMKLVAQAMNANKDFLVSGSKFANDAGEDAAWTRYLYGEGGDTSGKMKGKTAYIADMAVVRCPSFKYEDNNKALGAIDGGNTETNKRAKALAAAFGMVYRSSAASGAKFAGFDFRGTKFLKYESYAISPNQLMLGGCAVANSAPYDDPKALLYNGSWTNKLVKNHGDKCNVFFLDGHTEGLELSELENKYIPKPKTGSGDDDKDKSVKFTDSGWIDPDK